MIIFYYFTLNPYLINIINSIIKYLQIPWKSWEIKHNYFSVVYCCNLMNLHHNSSNLWLILEILFRSCFSIKIFFWSCLFWNFLSSRVWKSLEKIIAVVVAHVSWVIYLWWFDKWRRINAWDVLLFPLTSFFVYLFCKYFWMFSYLFNLNMFNKKVDFCDKFIIK